MDSTYTKEIRFANRVQLWLWYGELAGQISDGHWENARPHDHYHAFEYTQIRTVGKGEIPGKLNVWTRRKYNFASRELLNVVGTRMLFLAMAALAYPEAPITSVHSFSYLGEVGALQLGYAHAGFQKQYRLDLAAVCDVGNNLDGMLKVWDAVTAKPFTMYDLRHELMQMSRIINS